MSGAGRRNVLVFLLDGKAHALGLDAVVRVVRAVEIRPLPGARGIAMGVIDVAGVPVPVMDLRARLGLPPRKTVPADRFLLVRYSGRTVALPADSVTGVSTLPEESTVPVDGIVPAARPSSLAGIAALPDGMVFLHDLEAFLSATERAALEAALSDIPGQGDSRGPKRDGGGPHDG